MTPDWMHRLIPPGISRAKLMAVSGLLVSALGVAIYDVLWLNEDEPVVHAGTEALAESAGGASGPAPLTSQPGPRKAPTSPAGASEAAAPAAGSAPVAAPAGTVGTGSEPDWAALFAQLMARESHDGSGSGLDVEAVLPDSELQTLLSGFRLRGLIQDEQGGLALVNGRLVRPGDSLAGTNLTVASILHDRVLLRSPERTALVPLLLEPMHDGAAGAR